MRRAAPPRRRALRAALAPSPFAPPFPAPPSSAPPARRDRRPNHTPRAAPRAHAPGARGWDRRAPETETGGARAGAALVDPSPRAAAPRARRPRRDPPPLQHTGLSRRPRQGREGGGRRLSPAARLSHAGAARPPQRGLESRTAAAAVAGRLAGLCSVLCARLSLSALPAAGTAPAALFIISPFNTMRPHTVVRLVALAVAVAGAAAAASAPAGTPRRPLAAIPEAMAPSGAVSKNVLEGLEGSGCVPAPWGVRGMRARAARPGARGKRAGALPRTVESTARWPACDGGPRPRSARRPKTLRRARRVGPAHAAPPCRGRPSRSPTRVGAHRRAWRGGGRAAAELLALGGARAPRVASAARAPVQTPALHRPPRAHFPTPRSRSRCWGGCM